AQLLENAPAPAEAAETARRGLALALVELASGNDEHAAEYALAASEKLSDAHAQAGGSTIAVLSRFAVPASGLPARALALAARAKKLLGKTDEAAKLRARALTLAPRAPDLLLEETEHALLSGDLAAATRACEQAVAAAPEAPDLEARLGSLYLVGGKLEEAQACFEKALRLGAVDPLVFRDLARTLLARGKRTEAQEALERARDRGLDLVLHAEMRRELARSLGKKEEERAWLERLVAARPVDLELRRSLADMLAATNPAAAAEQYEAILRVDPVDAEALRASVRLAIEGLRAGTAFPGVVQARLKVARARLPEDRDLRALSGRLLLLIGNTEEALAELEGALDGAKVRSPDALFDRAIARMRLSSTTQGAREMMRAMTEAIAAADGKTVIAAFLKEAQGLALDSKQRALSRVALEALVQAAPRSHEARIACLTHLAELKDWKALKNAAEQALRDFPEDRVFFDFQARAEKEIAK
ncbi:hypothetical protein HY251_04760, partial [bacterium]|nr:hypothetical protein [bacterium]